MRHPLRDSFACRFWYLQMNQQLAHIFIEP
jgi:hypothetical protein